MCLSRLTSPFDLTEEDGSYVGWKWFERYGATIDGFLYGGGYRVNTWYFALGRRLPAKTSFYTSGFHFFADRHAAMLYLRCIGPGYFSHGLVLGRCLVQDVHTYGVSKDYIPTAVASRMKITHLFRLPTKIKVAPGRLWTGDLYKPAGVYHTHHPSGRIRFHNIFGSELCIATR